MSALTALLPALILLVAGLLAVARGVDAYDALVSGASDGLRIMVRIVPALIALLPAVSMLRASGALDALTNLLTPLLTELGIAPETVPLMLLRPFSGSGALAVGTELMERFGADSTIGRTAAIMLGSTETTFYVIAVYFGAAGIRRTRHAIPAALCADLAGFFMAAWTARWFFAS